ncbi:MAG: hypothetical protein Q7U97_17365 [Rhodocyclaceae bacterium]|jgi:hypothetical protein|nr:hypothetical protein [Rhodocyclaceae bacterium]
MAINSISSSTSAVTSGAGAGAQQVRPQKQPAQTQQVRQATDEAAKAPKPQAATPETRKPPVVNTQGQKTGTVINTTA